MRRHDLAYLHPGAAYTLIGTATPEAHDALRRWLHAGRPLVVARQPSPGGTTLFLGLTLPPPGMQPRRLGIAITLDAIMAVEPPLLLAQCLETSAPAATIAPLRRLQTRCERLGVSVHAYGSMAWERLSGMPYRHARSDIDLVCDITDACQLPGCLEALQATQLALPCSLDGEIRFAGALAVNWKELARAAQSPATRVVAKGNASVALVTTNALLASLKEPTHVC